MENLSVGQMLSWCNLYCEV